MTVDEGSELANVGDIGLYACPSLVWRSITIILLVNPSLTVTASLIWGLWGLQMAGDAWSPQMAVSEPPWLLVNPTGPN